MGRSGSIRARRVDVAAELGTFPGTRYASAFEVTVADADIRRPEEWARATFEGAPKALQWFVLIGWRYVLWFRLGPRPSADHVQGWRIVANAPDELVLEVRSSLATAHKVVRVDGSRVVTATFVRYERPLGRMIWSAVAPIHHRTEPYLLGHAAGHPAA
jgi:hypothetical protein